MADRIKLKSYFETGDKPTQEQFWELIDSMALLEDVTNGSVQLANSTEALGQTNNTKAMSPLLTKLVILSYIVDNLSAGGSQKALSAEQGKVLDLRLKDIERLLQADSDSIINSLYDIIEAFNGIPEGSQKVLQLLGLKADKNAVNLTATDVTAWIAKLNLYTKAQIDASQTAQNNNLSQNYYDAFMINNALQNIWDNCAFINGNNIQALPFLNNLGLSRGVKMIGRCEVYLGDPGGGTSGYYGCTIGYNSGITAVYKRPPGSYNINGNLINVPLNTTLYEVILTESVNPHKVVLKLVHQGDPYGFSESLYIGTTSNSYYFLLREGLAVVQNLYSHIFIYAEVNDYQ